MENVKKEIEFALETFKNKDLLLDYLLAITRKRYAEGQLSILDNYNSKLKQDDTKGKV